MTDAIVEIFEGKLGGGKTYSAVERIWFHLLKGGVLYTNIKLNWDVVKQAAFDKKGLSLQDIQYGYLDNDKIGHFPKFLTPGTDDLPVLCVIDEAHLFFNARDWKQTGRDVMEFLTQTRKVMVHMILITQSQLNLDKQFVRMVQYVWRFRDMQKFKFPLLGLGWPLPQILQVCFDATDPKHIMHREFKMKDKFIFSLYTSKDLLKEVQMLSKDAIVVDVGQSKSKFWTWFGKAKPWLMLLLFLVVGGFIIWYAYQRVFHKVKPEPKVAMAAAPVAGGAAPPPTPQASSVAANPYAESYWRPLPANPWPVEILTVKGIVWSPTRSRVNVLLSDGRVITEQDRRLTKIWRNGVLFDGQPVYLVESARTAPPVPVGTPAEAAGAAPGRTKLVNPVTIQQNVDIESEKPYDTHND